MYLDGRGCGLVKRENLTYIVDNPLYALAHELATFLSDSPIPNAPPHDDQRALQNILLRRTAGIPSELRPIRGTGSGTDGAASPARKRWRSSRVPGSRSGLRNGFWTIFGRFGRITRHSYKGSDTVQDAGSLRVGDDLPGAGTSACTAGA